HLQWRAKAFGSAYPFAAVPGEPLRRKAKLLKPQIVYAFLLLASNLRMVTSGTERASYAAAFEHLSTEALKRYLPASATVHRFHRQGTRYTGNVLKKIKMLAADIRE